MEAALLTSTVMFAVAGATAFGWIIAYCDIPDIIGNLIKRATSSPVISLLMITFLFIIVGDFMDAIPAMIIFMPIVTAIGTATGIHPVHLGVIVVLVLAFGLISIAKKGMLSFRNNSDKMSFSKFS